jgi:hypothetical protein
MSLAAMGNDAFVAILEERPALHELLLRQVLQTAFRTRSQSDDAGGQKTFVAVSKKRYFVTQ